MEWIECRRCGWPVLPNDVYCGGCGEKTSRISIASVKPDLNAKIHGNIIELTRYKDDRNLLKVSFQNKGLHTRILKIKDQRGMRAEPQIVILPPHEQSVNTTVTLSFEDSHQSSTQAVWTTEQGDSEIKLIVNWKPVPVITYEGPELVFRTTEDSSLSYPVTFSILHSDVNVRDLLIDPPWINFNQIRRKWKKNTTLTIQLTADPKTYEESDLNLSEITVSFNVLERNEPLIRKIPARLIRIPKPNVFSENPVSIQPSDKLLFTFSLHSTGKEYDESVLIENLDIKLTRRDKSDNLIPNLEYKWQGHSGIGDDVKTGSHTYTLEIDTSELPADSWYDMELQIFTNQSSDAPTTRYPVVLIVKPEKVFTGILALDFGTSYSMGAFKSDGKDIKYLPLDSTSNEVPSKIAYLTINDRFIGYKAENETLINPTLNQSRLLDSVKRFIGDSSRKIELAFGADRKTLSPKEVMRDYCAEMLSIFKQQEGKFEGHLMLTYPSKFSWKQSEEIRWVAQELGIPKEKSYFLDEARAVANYAIEQGIDIEPGTHFMVMDIGGGTTDIAICYKSDEPHPKIIDIAGDRYFGGENITDWIAELIVYLAELELSPRKVLFGQRIPESLRKNPATANDIAECRFNLLKSAFQIKKDWPVSKLTLPPLFIYDSNFEITKTDSKEIDFTDWMIIEDKTRDAIQSILNEVNFILKERGIKLSLIILAGQGGLFKPIKSMIEDIMKTDDIVQCRDLKGAVSRGAVAYTDYVIQGGNKIETQHLTRSALGIKLPLKDRPVLQFTEFIPRNREIPTRSPGRWFNWPQNRSVNEFKIFERWGPESYSNINKKSEDYIATDVVIIPSDLMAILDLKRCYLLLRMLEDETVSLCKFFCINEGEIDTLKILKPDIQKYTKNETVIYYEGPVRDIELFHPEVYTNLSGRPVFLMENSFSERVGK